MATKKFGTFGGVFTPSILTILGVIMYMRLGWVVGNAGLIGAILLIVVAHFISVTTGLSISSIATDKKVGAGGVYYVLSRSLGLPIGGAIGITLWIATALSIALYLVGFAESFNAYLNLDTSINSLRISGTIALAILGLIAIISTSFAIKTQYFIMAAIAISLVSIFAGSWEFAPAEVPLFGPSEGLSMMTVFAILFPAVTGFTAGIAMSGDLKNPKKSIPIGTISAIAVGFIVYISMAVFMAYAIDAERLRTDYNILMRIALFAPAVVAGIWGATLSSALGGILGGPRILQAMSIDRITPKIFGAGVGRNKEPRNALLLTFIIAEGGVLIGKLDMIAEVVSMFYLAAYGFINLSFFLESWASADFSPSFKVKRWIGLLGFIATFAVMFQLNPGAMVAAFIVIGGIYAYLQRRQIALSSGDVWTSVWSSLVMKGLQKMDATDDTTRNWKPNILLFTGGTEQRPHLIEISKAIAGQVGMVSNFDLVENPEADVLFPKHKQSVQDPVLQEYGIFGRRQEVKNVFQGIETIASTYGFSGVEPNTIMLGWAKNTKDPIWFAQMTQKLIALDYNVLYLDYDWNRKFGKYQQIDVWWHNLNNNVELTLNLIKFISRSTTWINAKIRVILINDTGKEGFEHRIHKMLDSYRIEAKVKVINNHLAKKSTYDLMKDESQGADLILAGIPEIKEGEEKDFVEKTTEMFESIGTTLLVKTSSILGKDVGQLHWTRNEEMNLPSSLPEDALIPLPHFQDAEAQERFTHLSMKIEELTTDLVEDQLASFENVFQALLNDCQKLAVQHLNDIDTIEVQDTQLSLLKEYNERTDLFIEEDIPFIKERLILFGNNILAFSKQVLPDISTRIRINHKQKAYKKLVKLYLENKFLEQAKQIQLIIGVSTALLTDILKDGLIESEKAFSNKGKLDLDLRESLNRNFNQTSEKISEICQRLNQSVKNSGRAWLTDLVEHLEHRKHEEGSNKKLSNKERQSLLTELSDYPLHWHRITDLLCSKLATDIKLHGVQLIIEQIGGQVGQELETSMTKVTKSRLEVAEQWLQLLQQQENLDLNRIPQVDQALEYDEIRIQELLSWANVAGETLPEQLELMNTESLNEISIHQGAEIESNTIDLLSSFTHLLSEELERPIRKHLSNAFHGNMEILSKLQNEINVLSQKVSYQKGVSDLEVTKQMATKTHENLQQLKQRFDAQNAELAIRMEDIIHSANGAMNTSTLLDYAVRVIPKVARKKSGSSLKKLIDLASESLSVLHDKLNHLFSLSESPESFMRTSLSINQNLSNIHDALRSYTDDLRVSEEVYEQIPFYYRQLFIGQQAAKDGLRHRSHELRRASEIMRPQHGEGSSLIVLGAPLSGKSLFAETLAKEIGQGKIVRIHPPVTGSTSIIDLKRTLEKLSGINRQRRSVMKSAEEGTIFLFEDIELWWSRADTQNKAIRHLADLVNNPDYTGRIILTCNPYAFKLMERQGLLADFTLPRISMLPMEKMAIKDVMLERHAAGGLGMRLEDKSEEGLSNKELRKLMDRYQEVSGGLIGVALHHWLNNIISCQDDVIGISFPIVRPFPEILDKEWLVLIGQFIIHRHLDAQRVQKLFNYKDHKKADLMIRQLLADGVIEEVLGSTYRLSPLVQTAFIKEAESWGLI
jgi:amino acid transporter